MANKKGTPTRWIEKLMRHSENEKKVFKKRCKEGA
jgi:hypothetical protein